MGFEPTTFSLARRCSTTEPLPLTGATVRPRRHSPRCRGSDSQYTLTSTAVHSCWRCQHSTIHTWKAVDSCHVGRRGRAGQSALFIIGTRPSYIDQRQPLWLPIQGSWPLCHRNRSSFLMAVKCWKRGNASSNDSSSIWKRLSLTSAPVASTRRT